MKAILYLSTLVALLSGCVGTPPIAQPSSEQTVGYQRTVVANHERWVDLQVYYPASHTTAEQLTATPEELAKVLADAYGMPAFLMKDERPLPVYIDAPVSEGRYPVLIFNHGHSSYARQNQENHIELASQGYVVIALNHPGFSLLSRNGDTLVYKNEDVGDYSKAEIEALLAQQAKDWQRLRATQTLSEWQTVMNEVEQSSFADVMDEFDQWVLNNQLVLNALLADKVFEASFATSLDLDKLGYFGHSFGGAVATHMNMQQPQVKASFNLDGPVFVQSVDQMAPGNYCFAYGDIGQSKDTDSNFAWINQPVAKAVGGCEMLFKDAGHMNFTDLNQLPILKRFGVLGPVDNTLMRQNLNIVLPAFFNQHLRQQGQISKLEGTELIQY